MKKLILLLTTSVIILCSCYSSAKSVNYTIINTNNEFAKAYTAATIINSEKEYNTFLMRRALIKKNPLKDIDFEKDSLILVFKDGRICKNCGMEIVRITEENNKIIITARETPPEENKPEQYFIKIDKTNLKAELKLEK